MVGKNTANKIGVGLKELGKSHEFVGQGLAQIPKFGISLVSTELGNKVWNTLIGAIGNIINEGFNTKRTKLPLRSMFTNMMFTFTDPTANQMREITRNWKDLVGGLKMHNFNSAFGALIEDPQEIVGAVKSAIPKFGKKFKLPSLGTFKNTLLGSDNAIQEITPDLVSKYSGFGDPLAANDLVEY